MQRSDGNGNVADTIVRRTDYALNDIPNPKAGLLPNIADQVNGLRTRKTEKENSKMNMRQELENELKGRTGFLDELKVLFSILLSSWIAMVVWIMFFLFFMSIEMFVLVNKFGDEKNDYDSIISHQKDVRIKILNKLAE
jgi:hypothetical protein